MRRRTAASDVTGPSPAGASAADADGPGAQAEVVAIDATRLRVVIARLSRRMRRHQLAELTPTQLSALSTVERAGPLRLGDVAAAEGIAPSTLTRTVSVLESRGYVKRCAVPGDARASTLAITPRGREVLKRIRQDSTAMLAGLLMRLTPERTAALARAIPVLEQLAEVEPREPRADAGSRQADARSRQADARSRQARQ